MKPIQRLLILLACMQLSVMAYAVDALIPAFSYYSQPSFEMAHITESIVQDMTSPSRSMFGQPYDAVLTRYTQSDGNEYEYIAISDMSWNRIVVGYNDASEGSFLELLDPEGATDPNIGLLTLQSQTLLKPTGMDLRHLGSLPTNDNIAWLAIADKGATVGNALDGSIHICRIEFDEYGGYDFYEVHEIVNLKDPIDVALDVFNSSTTSLVMNVFVCDEQRTDLVWARVINGYTSFTSIVPSTGVDHPTCVTRISEGTSFSLSSLNDGYYVYNRYGDIALFKMDDSGSDYYFTPNVIDQKSLNKEFGRGIPLAAFGAGLWKCNILVPAVNEDCLYSIFLKDDAEDDGFTVANAEIGISNPIYLGEATMEPTYGTRLMNHPRALFHSSQPPDIHGATSDESYLGEVHVIENYMANSGFWLLNLSSVVQPMTSYVTHSVLEYARTAYVEIPKPFQLVPVSCQVKKNGVPYDTYTWNSTSDLYANSGISRIYFDDETHSDGISFTFLDSENYSKWDVTFSYDSYYIPYEYDDGNTNNPHPPTSTGNSTSTSFYGGKILLATTDVIEEIEGSAYGTSADITWEELTKSINGRDAPVERYQLRWKRADQSTYTYVNQVYGTYYNINSNDHPVLPNTEIQVGVRGVSNVTGTTLPNWSQTISVQLATARPTDITFQGFDGNGDYVFRVHRQGNATDDRATQLVLRWAERFSDLTWSPISTSKVVSCLPGESYNEITVDREAIDPLKSWRITAASIYDGTESEPKVFNFRITTYTAQGTVNGSEVWWAEDAEGNPITIHITGPLTISETGQIVVEAGAVVKFDSNASVTINGRFNCEGTSTDRVTFDPYIADQYYPGIIFQGYDGDDFALKYTDLDWCQKVWIQPHPTQGYQEGGWPRISHCTFDNAIGFLGPLWVQDRGAVIVENDFLSSDGYGLYMENADGIVFRNLIENAEVGGLILQSCTSMDVKSNTIQYCDYNGIALSGCVGINLVGNIVRYCGQSGGISSAALFMNNTSPFMVHNQLYNNYVQGMYCVNGSMPVMWRAANLLYYPEGAFNSIHDNNSSSGRGEITLRGNNLMIQMNNGHNNIYNPAYYLIKQFRTVTGTPSGDWDISGNYFDDAVAGDFSVDDFNLIFEPQDDELNVYAPSQGGVTPASVNLAQEQLDKVFRYEYDEKYDQAALACLKLIEEFPDSRLSIIGLDRLVGNRVRARGRINALSQQEYQRLSNVVDRMDGEDQRLAQRYLRAYQLTQGKDDILADYANCVNTATNLTDSVFALLTYFDAIMLASDADTTKGIKTGAQKAYSLASFPRGPISANKARDELLAKLEGVQAGDLLPKEFQLYQNYPNPFNPSTLIRFDVPVKSNVKIIIYNMLGQEVCTLINKPLTPGHRAIYWNGRNQANIEVASGMYFVQMKVAQFSKVKKMVLIK